MLVNQQLGVFEARPKRPPTLPPPLHCRYSYSSYRLYSRRIREVQAEHAGLRGGADPPQLSLPPTAALDPEVDDAFDTIMAWLHSRIPGTR